MVIGAPSDENECRQMLYTGFQHPGPAAIRYPRGTGPDAIVANAMTQLEIGKALEVRSGERLAILNFGTLLPEAMAAAHQLNATVVDMRWVKPMDTAAVMELAQSHDLLVTLEENSIAGGAGAAVNEYIAAQGQTTALMNLGLPDQFVEHGSYVNQLTWTGLDHATICQDIEFRLNSMETSTSLYKDLKVPNELALKTQ
jgi:1-deoxy-D-xylulose-5-phosphate synthase